MSRLHLKITTAEPKAHFDASSGTLHLEKSGSFKVFIVEYEQAKKILQDKIKKLQSANADNEKAQNAEYKRLIDMHSKWASLTPKQREAYRQDEQIYRQNGENTRKIRAANDKEITVLNSKLSALRDEYKDVRWIWQAANDAPDSGKDDYNKALGTGLVQGADDFMTLTFSAVLEGGRAYIEAYHYNPVAEKDKATGKMIKRQYYPQNQVPFGAFITAKGTPKVVTAEWKDKHGVNIKGDVAYGSTVYLHIYTEGLYGKDINILLRDTKYKNADLTLTDADAEGQPIERLDARGSDKYFLRKVWTSIYEPGSPQLNLPDKVRSGVLINKPPGAHDAKRLETLQKCVFPVFVDYKWEYEGGEDLKINPIVYRGELENGQIDLDDCVLSVTKEDGTFYKGELHGNSPVTTGDGSIQDTDGKKRIDFLFGVFIDGTLNNMYNTIARKKWEDDQITQKNKNKEDPQEHLEVAADSQGDIGKKRDHNYKYENESSYENDLSNPAILFQNYKERDLRTPEEKQASPELRIFTVYSEGMGTDTVASDDADVKNQNYELRPEDYKTDDIGGFAFGMGESGMILRVKRAIELMVKKIKIDPKSETIGLLTIDVFGFSRGAASSRIFAHEVTLPPMPAGWHYQAKWDPNPVLPVRAERYLGDHNGNRVADEYKDKPLPPCGWLGYQLLHGKNLNADRVSVRFAGLYDTVPHHGLSQGNDIDELGLNSIRNARYTVHLVAGDEHRKNFSLVDISCITGTKGGGHTARGVELYLPGVHCDVGGSYVEGRRERNGRILTNQYFDQNDLHAEKERLIEQGWYKPKEINVEWDNLLRIWAYGAGKVLVGDRAHISHRYSYIPLHIMTEFALQKKLPIDKDSLIKAFNLKDTTFSNKEFLERIKDQLYQYAFNGAARYDYVAVPQQTIVYSADDHTAPQREEIRRKAQEAELNADIKRLRHEYLHWNANYGEGGSAMDSMKKILAQPNEPNFEGGKRKRKVRGT
jgi:hypothetical protein